MARIAEVVHGYRTIAGTDWPVTSHVERYGPRRWVVTWGLCSGSPVESIVYRTRRAALAALYGEGGLVMEDEG